MSKYKILVIITGSIAAYKTAYLISKLMQDGFDVEVVVTKSALKFIGVATLEGLIHKPVRSDIFEEGKMMSHIDLTKWADLTIVAPADANTINKFANGIADNLVTSLFLAHDQNKPYLIAPAMNTAMFNHPATRESLEKLKKWGIGILPTDTGYLACGDVGDGKMLEPDLIFGHICNQVNNLRNTNLKVLITGGGTIENIDGVRSLSNMSSGKTVNNIAEYFYINGADVKLLLSETAVKSTYNIDTSSFNTFESLKILLNSELTKNKYDLVIHAAAVSDYSPTKIEFSVSEVKLPSENKIASSENEFKIILSKNIKLIDKIKDWSLNRDVKLVAFKLLNKHNDDRKTSEISKLFDNSQADCVVFNSLSNRTNDMQSSFEIFKNNEESISTETSDELAKELFNIWSSK